LGAQRRPAGVGRTLGKIELKSQDIKKKKKLNHLVKRGTRRGSSIPEGPRCNTARFGKSRGRRIKSS